MASEYSVNIRLNTAQVKKDLKTIGSEISNLGKKESKSSKNALSATDQKLKLEQKTLSLQNRILTVGNSRLKTITKENKLIGTKSLLTRANNQALQGEFELSKKNILKAIQQIKTLQKEQLIRKGIQTQVTNKVKVEDTINKQLQERVKTLGQIVKLRNLGSSAGRLAGRFDFEDSLNTRGPGGSMLALPSAQMLDQRVKATGQAGGFSRAIPRFRMPSPTRGFDFGSALISGGFPLLFGQGPVTAAAGALGGGIGGMFGQMGGFAGGIAATAAVQSINQVIASVSELGQAMSSVNPNIDALAKAVGVAGTAEEKRLKLIEQVNGKQAALNAAMDKMREVIGDEATERLKKFGETTRLISNDFAIMITKMQAALVPLFNFVDNILGLSKGAKERQRDRALANTDNTEVLDIQNRISELRSASGGGRSGSNLRNKEIAKLTIALNKLGDKLVIENKAKTDKEIKDLEDKSGKGTKENIDLKIKSIETEINLRELNNNLLNNEVVSLKESLIAEEHKVALAEAKGDEDLINLANAEKANKLSILSADIAKAELDLAKEFNDEQEKRNRLRDQEAKRIQAIKDSAEARILDIEKENELREFALTATAEEIAFKKIVLSLSKDELALIDEKRLKQAIADSERITALERQKEIIDEIQFTLASSMSDAIKGLITGTHSLNSALSSVLNKMADAMLNMGLFGNVGGSLIGGRGLLGNLFGGLLHAGGPAKGGRSYIVGEKGPEMFTPGVSGMVTPNSALGGSNNIVVNVDASGTEVEGDEASSSQLGKLIGLAVQQELVKQSRAGGLLSRA